MNTHNHSKARAEENIVLTHKLINDIIYPNHHFPSYKQGKEVWVQSNTIINIGDLIVLNGTFKVTKVLKVEKTVNELTGYWDTQAKGKRVWINPIRTFNEQTTKFYTLEIEKSYEN